MNEPALKYELEWSRVHPDILDECWEDCAKLLKKSVKRSGGRVTIDDAYRDVDSGRSQLWIVYSTSDMKIIGCLVTFVREYATGLRMLHFDHIAGIKMDEWFTDGLEMLKKYSRQNGYDGLEGIGRPGFWNWIKDIGWKRPAIFFEVRINY